MIIHVTPAHIAAGQAFCPFGCMIALALKEATGRTWIVNGEYASLNGVRVPLPSEAVSALVAFDAGLRVEPFAFEFGWEG